MKTNKEIDEISNRMACLGRKITDVLMEEQLFRPRFAPTVILGALETVVGITLYQLPDNKKHWELFKREVEDVFIKIEEVRKEEGKNQ